MLKHTRTIMNTHYINISLRMFYIVIHERNPVITFVPQCFSIYSTGRHFEFQATIFTLHISIKGDASFPGTTFPIAPIATFLGTKFRLGVGLELALGLRLWFGVEIMGIIVTAIVLPEISVPGIVRKVYSQRSSIIKIIFISFSLKFWHITS